MAKAKKINQEELSNLKKAAEMVDQAELIIGRLEIRKLQAVAEHESLMNEFKAHKGQLFDKYGEVNINFETGEYTETETTKESAE